MRVIATTGGVWRPRDSEADRCPTVGQLSAFLGGHEVMPREDPPSASATWPPPYVCFWVARANAYDDVAWLKPSASSCAATCAH